MHTIDMLMTLDHCDTRFEGAMALCKETMPHGIEFWSKPAPYRRGEWVFSLKLDAHLITQKVNIAKQDLLLIENEVRAFLIEEGLIIEDFTMNRIDYDHNVQFSSILEMEWIISLLLKVPVKACYAKRRGNYKTSLYHHSDSRVTQVYIKDVERMDKCQPIADYEKLVLRQEVQVKPRHIAQMNRYHNIPKTWDAWVTMQRQAEYLAKTKDLIPNGGFYSLNAARALVDAAALKAREKVFLKNFLEEISNTDMETAKSKMSTNTYKKYLGKLEMLNINPITIPEEMKLDHIPFPLFKAS